jgi:hypothetical protein
MSGISAPTVVATAPSVSAKSEVAAPSSTTATSASTTSASTSTTVPTVLYPSPRIYIDPTLDTVIFETRDPVTGEAIQQIPSEQQLRLYRLEALTSNNGATPGSITHGPVLV